MVERKASPSRLVGLLSFFNDKLNMKDFLCNQFVFKPPSLGYSFEIGSVFEGKNIYKFFLKEQKKNVTINVPDFLTIEPHMLGFRDRKAKLVKLPLVLIKNAVAQKDNIIVYSHGNASDLGDVVHYAICLSTLYRINLLVYDYRGYGISNADKSEQTLYEDLEVVLAYCVEDLRIDIRKIILWGFSIGTAPTVEISSRYFNIGGVVLQAPLASLQAWLSNHIDSETDYDINDLFCNLHKIENVKSKIFIMHGNKDNVINVRHSHLLFERFQSHGMENSLMSFVVADGVGHNDIQNLVIDGRSEFSRKTKKFLHSCLSPKKHDLEKIARFKAFFRERELESLSLVFSNIRVDLDH